MTKEQTHDLAFVKSVIINSHKKYIQSYKFNKKEEDDIFNSVARNSLVQDIALLSTINLKSLCKEIPVRVRSLYNKIVQEKINAEILMRQ